MVVILGESVQEFSLLGSFDGRVLQELFKGLLSRDHALEMLEVFQH
jgi:hypothetical protein